MTLSDQEWDQRILCSDGNCIGIIGADGRCKECGTPYTGDLPLPTIDSDDGGKDDVDRSARQATDAADPVAVDTAIPTTASVDAEDRWEDRILCVDENCIGVVGPDGRCNECGKSYPG